MRQLLILCDLFPPAFGPRMGYLCKYLVQYGWQPTVISEQVDDGGAFDFLVGTTEVIYLDFGQQRGRSVGIFSALADFVFQHKDRRMYRKAMQLINSRRFDAILCSTFRTFPLTAARLVAQRTGLPLITDLRDIIEQYTGTEYIARPLPRLFGLEKWLAAAFRWHNLRLRNRSLQQANHVTTVSPWHVDTLQVHNPNISLIYNGYDPELFFPDRSAATTNSFTITYTGRLLSLAMRNPELLFSAVRRLAAEGIIDPATFRISWYTDPASTRLLRDEVARYGLEAFNDYPGYVPAAAIPNILRNSSLLLLLTNRADADGPKGIMTTKFFEALAVDRPILCVRGDEGCLEALIHRTQAGLSAHSEEEVYHFLVARYREWQSAGFVAGSSDRDAIRTFSRREQAGQFAELLNRLISPHA